MKKIDEAIQLQSDFAKSAYEDFVTQATKIGEIYSSLAKEAFKQKRSRRLRSQQWSLSRRGRRTLNRTYLP